MSDLFERATKQAARYHTSKGAISTEDLWALNLQDLDVIAKGLHNDLRDDEVSFVNKPTEQNSLTQLKLDVVKRVIEVRLAEREAAAQRKNDLAKKKFLQEVLHEKKAEALKNLSIEEIEKELAQL